MIHKLLKWIGIALGSLPGLLVLAFVASAQSNGTKCTVSMTCQHWHLDNLGGQAAGAPMVVTLSVPNLTSGAEVFWLRSFL